MESKRWEKERRFFSLSSKFIFIYTSIIGTIIVIIAAIIGQVSATMVRQKSVDSCIRELDFAAERLDAFLAKLDGEMLFLTMNQAHQRENGTKVLDAAYELHQRSQAVSSFLMDFLASQPMADSVTFYTTDGLYFYQDNDRNECKRMEALPEAVEQLAASEEIGRWHVGWSQSGLKSIPSFCLLKKAYDFDGTPAGIFVVLVPERNIAQIYSGHRADKISFEIIDRSGRICSSTNAGRIGFFADIPPGAWRKPPGTEAACCDYEGNLFTYRDYGRLGLELRMMAVIADHFVYHDSRLLVLMIAGTGLLFLLVSFLLVNRLTKRIIAPLNRVTAGVCVISKGDYAARIGNTSRDEIGILAMQIDRMAENTQKLMALIQSEGEQKRRFELSYQQAQMQPHFLYNTLETICGMIEVGDKAGAISMMNDVSRFYRQVLNKGAPVVSVGQEVALTQSYLRIMQRRYAGSFQFTVDVEQEIERLKIPKLSLQPLVENAIIHGIVGAGRNGTVTILGRREGNLARLSVLDDGAGMTKRAVEALSQRISQDEEADHSFGVNSIRRRLRLYLGKEAQIEIHSSSSYGTTVSLLIPDHLKEEGLCTGLS